MLWGWFMGLAFSLSWPGRQHAAIPCRLKTVCEAWLSCVISMTCDRYRFHICRYDGAGAVWDIYRRQDVQLLSAFLAAHAGDFTHMGEPVSLPPCSFAAAAAGAATAAGGSSGGSAGSSGGSNGGSSGAESGASLWPLFSQQFMLAERHRQALRAETGAHIVVHKWVIGYRPASQPRTEVLFDSCDKTTGRMVCSALPVCLPLCHRLSYNLKLQPLVGM
jgi:hypothetical protein